MQAQQVDKIKFKSFDYGVVGIYTTLKPEGVRGFTSNLEFSGSYKKNIVSLDFNFGFGITKANNSIHDLQAFFGIDLLYSKQYKVSNVLSLEPQAGLGYIIQSNTSRAGGRSALAFPLKCKVLFYTSKSFALGFVPSVNINNVNTFYTFSGAVHTDF